MIISVSGVVMRFSLYQGMVGPMANNLVEVYI